MESSRHIRFGSFEADLRAHELRKGGLKLKLQEQPFQVLAILLDRPGELVTREEIRARLWPGDTLVDFDHGLNAAVRRLREALNDNAETPRFVETLPRRGYRFIAPVVTGNHSAGATVVSGAERDGHPAPARPRRRRFLVMAAWLAAIAAGLLAFNVRGVRDRIFNKPSDHIRSIAVLPLQNLSPDNDHAYFAAGMTDELITDLSKISSLRVIARTSSMAYKGAKEPLAEIARKLNVDAVVEGSVEQVGGRVRINVRLADASTGRDVWAQSYERDSQDVLRLQNEVAQAIAEKIQAKVTPQEQHRLQMARTVNPAAHDAYLRGWYLFDQRHPSEAVRSTQYFRNAIQLDPDYASAYAGLSISLVLGSYLEPSRASDFIRSARAAARHALQLDPDLGEAYTALGAIDVSYDWNWKAAKQDLQRGIQLTPGDPYAEIFYGFYLQAMGRPREGVVQLRRAVRVDPVSFFANRQLGALLYFDRQYDAALAQLQRTQELANYPPGIDGWRCWIYAAKGMHDEAVRDDLRKLTFQGLSPADLKFFRSAYARGGWPAYWQAQISRLGQMVETKDPYTLGVWYLRAGNVDEAFHWLNRAVDQHSVWLVALPVDPKLDSIRSDPRFQALLHRMHLPAKSTTRTP
jgi:TolB-like protein/DNA-binding winged helix-turn-helix (wHTH) protein